MKIVLTFLIAIVSQISMAQNLHFLTYNIRYGAANDGKNSWDFRKAGLVKQLKFYEPDVFGIQEGLNFQVDFLDSALSDYTYYGVGRDDGKTQGEYSAIFFKKDKFNIIESKTFWLSETPGKVSVGWDAALPRICTAVLFEEKDTKKRFWFFNTHFDHKGEEARKNSAKLIINKIDEYKRKGYPVVLTGDFNLEPDSEAIAFIKEHLADSKSVAKKVIFGPEGTFNGFNFEEPVTRRIDYIFVDKNAVEVLKYAVLSDSIDLKYYSDHLPVYTEVKLK